MLIERIVDAVKDKGIYDDTLFVFLSDNGGSTGMARGQNLPLRGVKGSKFEGGTRTAAFVYGGYVDKQIDNFAGCDFDDLFFVPDWFPTLLQMAEGGDSALTNGAIAETLSSEATPIDGIGAWSNMLAECGNSNGYAQPEDSREWVFSAKMCDDSYFIKTYVRHNGWKLIVNNTNDCGENSPPSTAEFYTCYDCMAGNLQRSPPLEIYEQFMRRDNAQYFQSECFDAMSDDEKVDEANFEYTELMLFEVERDPIEACNVADAHPDIVEEMLGELFAQVQGRYIGQGSTKAVPTAPAVMRQFMNFDCEYDQTYYHSWEEDACCSDPEFDDWNAVWKTAVDVRKDCDDYK